MSQQSDNGGPLNWTTYPSRSPREYHARTSAMLSVFSEEIYFTKEGRQMGGHFEVSQTGERGSDAVVVDIQADYHRADALDELQVFHLSTEQNKEGIEIYVRPYPTFFL